MDEIQRKYLFGATVIIICFGIITMGFYLILPNAIVELLYSDFIQNHRYVHYKVVHRFGGL